MRVTSLICGGSLSLLTCFSLAQQPPGQTPGTRPVTPGQRTAPGTTAAQPTPGMQAGSPVRLSQIIGSTVQSAQGQSLGQVQDVIVDPTTGRIDFAVLSLSGTPGTTTAPGATTTPGATTGNLVPVPWPLFGRSFGMAGTRGTTDFGAARALTLNIDPTRLQTAPAFDQNNWNTLHQGDFGQRSYSFFGLDWNRRAMTGTGTPGAGVSTGAGTSGTRVPGTATPGTSTPGTTTPGTRTPGAGTTTPGPGAGATPPGTGAGTTTPGTGATGTPPGGTTAPK